MGLSDDLISQFVKVTKDDTKEVVDTTRYGTTVKYNGDIYVKIDGSDRLTPVNTTIALQPDERVVVDIKNHTATVTGNLSSPSARNSDVENISSQITEMDIVIANKVNTKELEAQVARINTLTSDNLTVKENLTAANAKIEALEADNVKINGTLTANKALIDDLSTKKLDAEVADITYASIEELEATNADIHNLNADYGTFKDLATNNFKANNADINELKTKKLDAESAKITYANIDFSNIGKAAMEYLYATSGLIKDVVISNGTITGNLVGVTIKGDLIEGNTVVADKLVLKGEDGIYYKLNTDGVKIEAEQTDYNSLNGSIITAKSITATKISVDDLVAFDATIGGFNITESSIYSGVKETVDNTTRGVYLDKNGQVAFGDSANFIKYYKGTDGTYKLELCANSIKLGSKTIGDLVDEGVDGLEIGTRNLIPNSKTMSDFTTSTYSTIDSEDEEGFAIGRYIARDTLSYNALNTPYIPYTLVRNRTITLSLWVRSDDYEALNSVTTGKGLCIDARVYPKDNPSSGNKYRRFLNVYSVTNLTDEWQLVHGTATITDDYFTEVGNDGVDMSDPSALNFRFNMYNYSLYTLEVKKLKLEYGDKATDWSPAPEDLATSGDVIDAKNTADDAISRIEVAESTILQLAESISMLITNADGGSLMTQTSDGWTFNIGSIIDTLGSATGDINSIDNNLSNVNSIVEGLGQSVSDLSILANYIRIITSGGQPCIELGEGDSDFKLRITNTNIEFFNGSSSLAHMSNDSLYINKAVIEDELQIGGFVWKERANGNVGLVWRGGS